MAFKKYFYYHPESDSLWEQAEPYDLEKRDGLVEEITYEEYLKLQSQQKGTTMQLPDNLDTRNIPPQQGISTHPAGMFAFQITNTYLKDTPVKEQVKTGAMLVVEFTSDAGRIENRYNIVNPSQQAMEIAQKELSALTHAIGIFQVAFPKKPDGTPNYEMAGHTLRGGRGKMEVAPQTDKEGKPNGYMEVKKVFDINGNEPGKGGGGAPMTQQANGSWSNNQQPQQNNGWNNQPPQQQPQNNPPPQQQPTQQQQPPQGWNNQPQQGQQQQPNNGWQQQPPQNQGQPQQQQGNGAPPWAQNR